MSQSDRSLIKRSLPTVRGFEKKLRYVRTVKRVEISQTTKSQSDISLIK